MCSTKYRFDEFELDPAARDLLRNGERVALPPKSFECLAYLLSHRDRAVGRDELISAVWGRIEVSDTVVAQTLLRARKAIGDSGGRQLLIRTVPRFGYRWIAPVREGTAEAATLASVRVPQARTAQAVLGTRAGGPGWYGWWSVFVLLSVAAFAGWLLPDRMLRAAPDPPALRPPATAPTSLSDLAEACRAAVHEGDAHTGECTPAHCAPSTNRIRAGSLGGCAEGDDAWQRQFEGGAPPRFRHAE